MFVNFDFFLINQICIVISVPTSPHSVKKPDLLIHWNRINFRKNIHIWSIFVPYHASGNNCCHLFLCKCENIKVHKGKILLDNFIIPYNTTKYNKKKQNKHLVGNGYHYSSRTTVEMDGNLLTLEVRFQNIRANNTVLRFTYLIVKWVNAKHTQFTIEFLVVSIVKCKQLITKFLVCF